MKKYFAPFFLLFLSAGLLLNSCTAENSFNDEDTDTNSTAQILEIKGADFSLLPEVRESGQVYYNASGVQEDMLTTFKNAGGNTVRLRLWVDPETPTSGFQSVKELAEEIKTSGLKLILSVHYSDTWADPSQQTKPAAWNSLSFDQLKTEVYDYTKLIADEIRPDYIQIGNEINNGFLWPEGEITNSDQFLSLLKQGIAGARASESHPKIIIHYAGYNNAVAFYTQLGDLDYDIIGISYYPLWHGKSIPVLKQKLTELSQTFNKKILIAETSYPFTLEWNDQTNNVVGLESQLIPGIEASVAGQKEFLNQIKTVSKQIPNGIGFCYWGAEWTAFQGTDATDGSSWENQAFWDFSNTALPVLDNYKD